jgi:hypothetical protein
MGFTTEDVDSPEEMYQQQQDKEARRKEFADRAITRVPADKEGITVRFASNPAPGNWLKVYQIFDQSVPPKGMAFPCEKDDVARDGKKASVRYLINCVDTRENKAIVLNLPDFGVVTPLMRKWEKYGTLTDRDWTFSLHGTDYDIEAERETDRDLSRYTFKNLKEVWEAEYNATLALRPEYLSKESKPKKSL